MERFSKKKLVAYLERQIDFFERSYNFRSGYGYKQVENQPLPIIIAYGKWKECRDILEDLGNGDL